MGFLGFVSGNILEILARALDHIQLTLIAITIASFLGVPLGVLISHIKPLKKPIMGFANVVQAIPSIALLGFLVPFLGIGEKPAVCMVVIYSLLPIVKNTATGLSNINRQTLEAAKGIGMTRFQVLRKVKLPLALPVIMAGIRISAVSSVGLVTLSAFIGASGLGYLIYSGIRTLNNYQILSGAIPACILALLVDFITSLIEKAVTPECFREKIKQ
jgi:osmoprotectant transport system permease protein